jgi:small subunit ribosomal protein S1
MGRIVGELIDTQVTRLEPYGAWIEDNAGNPGLVVIPEISWSRISHPGDVLAVGKHVTVKILALPADRPFAASLRAVHPEDDPWFKPELFAVGTRFRATVVQVLEYGCFVELRPEVRGLLRREHWPARLELGDLLDVKVTSSNSESRRVEVALC